MKKDKDKEPIWLYLADWLYSKGDSKGYTYAEIGAKLYGLKNDTPKTPEYTSIPYERRPTKHEISHWISLARRHLQLTKQLNIVNVPTFGYKLANQSEANDFAVKAVKRWVYHTENTRIAITCADIRTVRAEFKKLLPEVRTTLEDLRHEIGEPVLGVFEEIKEHEKEELKKQKERGHVQKQLNSIPA